MSTYKTINQTDDFISKKVHVGETIIYKGKHYTFSGLSAYECDLKNILSMIREIPEECFNVPDQYVGKKFIYKGYIVEVLQKNKNGTYSIQSYNKKGKKEGGKFSILKQDTENLISL
jgi:hypothetical protein